MVCACSFLGQVNSYAQIWALTRHFGHMGCMLDSDWSTKILLLSDWLTTKGAPITTVDNHDNVVDIINCVALICITKKMLVEMRFFRKKY